MIASCSAMPLTKLLEKSVLISFNSGGELITCCVLPQTEHSGPIETGAVGRQGMSVERTFPPVSRPEDLQAWVRPLPCLLTS